MQTSTTSTFDVTWHRAGQEPKTGELQLDGARATLAGAGTYSFDLSEVETILITPAPAVHLRLRNRGWLILRSALAFELASALSQLVAA